jgi:sulfite exporter TauE/SafE
MDGSLIGTLGLGFVLGLKHALDADHLVAVSTIVGRERSIWKSAWVGVIWGMGHTASLFVAAVVVIVLRISISPTVAMSLEFCVGLMLMILGADLLRRVVRGDIAVHSHPHVHDDAERHRHGVGEPHAHLHVHTPITSGNAHAHHGVGRRPFFVGLVHGMAGSAALMLFVLSTIDSPWAALLYVLIFGAGTIGGMLVMSGLIGLPFALASRRLSTMVGRIQVVVGLGSLLFGAAYIWQVAVRDGLLAALLP